MKTVEKASYSKQHEKNGAPKAAVITKASLKIDDVLNPTAESRLKRLDNFQILAERHKFLTSKNDELQKFIVSSDGTKEKIILKNAQGFELEVSNSNVVDKVVQVVKEELQKITDASETEVLNFHI